MDARLALEIVAEQSGDATLQEMKEKLAKKERELEQSREVCKSLNVQNRKLRDQLFRDPGFQFGQAPSRKRNRMNTWKGFAESAGFVAIGHYYRPPGRPRSQQPWLASTWRKPVQ